MCCSLLTGGPLAALHDCRWFFGSLNDAVKKNSKNKTLLGFGVHRLVSAVSQRSGRTFRKVRRWNNAHTVFAFRNRQSPGNGGVSQCGQGPRGCMYLLSLSSYKLAGFKHFALNLLWPLQEIAGPSLWG